MNFIKTSLSGLTLIKPNVHGDARGFFLETYSAPVFKAAGIDSVFVQDNHSRSLQKNVIRGLHFQKPPFEQSKLVRVIRGSIFDVAVDIRRGSATCGRWLGFELSERNFDMLFVPRGFAHGFCTLEEGTEVVYKVDSVYSRECDAGIIWNDPDIGVDWPLGMGGEPVLSDKDSKLPLLKEIQRLF